MDHARSSHPAVQRQLDRLAALSPGRDILGLERITALLARLGDPQRALPPVLHVAGTNGKGSVCAYLRAAIEAAGLTCHVYTSPHLVRFNERIRIAGRLIEDDALAALVAETLDAAEGIGASFFEITTAAMFLAFSRAPADACVIEVGLGGRLDATNVIERPLVCGIAALGVDHQAFLGDEAETIAAEKAGIARPGAPLVTLRYADPIARSIDAVAAATGAKWLPRGGEWDATVEGSGLAYRDAKGELALPLPRMAGPHQPDNAAIAVAMLRHQNALIIPAAALAQAMDRAEWPARLQRLGNGALTRLLPPGVPLWLDGAHNPNAAAAVAEHFKGARDLRLILGLLANKDPEGVLAPFAGIAQSACFVPVAGHDSHSPEALVQAAEHLGIRARAAPDLPEALATIETLSPRTTVAIIGSLYLAGEALALNGETPG
ncbi:MAG: bifunctional folylpolyglutamate synthase/dihydrofolate synthase [Sphingomonadaceae bacterium]|nr:bifunctional folylpolyglutamate synthase/dihydrofolate synthase [Sphingomonadaceae bacterium]